MTQVEAAAELERQTAKREAGICTISGCENPHEGRTLGRCREHGGANPLPARSHRSLQHTGWQNYWS